MKFAKVIILAVSVFIVLATSVLNTAEASNVPGSFTYQGKILNANGTQPLQSGNVTFTLQIRSPDATCLLYEETHVRNMTGTGGVFSLNVGEGTNTGKTALNLAQIVDNTLSKTGDASCVYQPISGDTRRIRLIYDEGSGPVTFAVDQTLRSVPFAMNASALQGKTKDSFVQISAGVTQAKMEQLAAGTFAGYAKASDLPLTGGILDLSGGGVRVADTPTTADQAVNRNYVDARVAAVTGALTAAQIPAPGGDVRGTHAATVVERIQGVSVSIVPPTNGQVMTYNSAISKWEAATPYSGPTSGSAAGQVLSWNGSAWIGGFPNVSQLRGVASAQQFPTNCTSSQTLVYFSPMDRYECQTISVSAASITGLGGAATLSVGTTAGTVAAGNDSRLTNALQPSSAAGGDASGTLSNLSVLKIRGVSVTAAAPAANQVLKYDNATSTLIFAGDSNSGGTVTSLTPGTGFTSNTPITSTGTLSVDVGTGPNQILQMGSDGKLPAMNASNLTGLPFQNVVSVSSNWTPPAGVRRVYVQVWGGGGAGANGVILGISGSGGGGGGYASGYVDVTAGTPVSVTVGAGGAASGAAGGTSSFGSISASGGAGGAVSSITGALGGNTLVGTITAIGGSGLIGTAGVTIVAVTVAGVGGQGGTAGGGGGLGGFGSLGATAAGAGTVPGGGGGGGGSALAAGTFGAGGAGRVLVWY